VGGPGSIAAFRDRGIQALVVGQAAQIHGEIEQLLTKLRAVREEERAKRDCESLPLLPTPTPALGFGGTEGGQPGNTGGGMF